MFTFYSQLTETQTRGKQTKTVPVLASVLMSVRPGAQGWFSAELRVRRDTALRIMSRIIGKVPDLIVEDEQHQRVLLPVHESAAVAC